MSLFWTSSFCLFSFWCILLLCHPNIFIMSILARISLDRLYSQSSFDSIDSSATGYLHVHTVSPSNMHVFGISCVCTSVYEHPMSISISTSIFPSIQVINGTWLQVVYQIYIENDMHNSKGIAQEITNNFRCISDKPCRNHASYCLFP